MPIVFRSWRQEWRHPQYGRRTNTRLPSSGQEGGWVAAVGRRVGGWQQCRWPVSPSFLFTPDLGTPHHPPPPSPPVLTILLTQFSLSLSSFRVRPFHPSHLSSSPFYHYSQLLSSTVSHLALSTSFLFFFSLARPFHSFPYNSCLLYFQALHFTPP